MDKKLTKYDMHLYVPQTDVQSTFSVLILGGLGMHPAENFEN